MRIKKEENAYYLYLFYDVNCKTKDDAIKKFVSYTKNSSITVHSIRIDDGKSYHDGTCTQEYMKITDEDAFIRKCCESPLESISFSGEYNRRPFALRISLETLQIRLSCVKDSLVDYDSLECKLDLN